MSESTTAILEDSRPKPRTAQAAPRRAMVLSAGIGLRMRPLTDRMPKPLVRVGDRALIDYVLDRLADAGVERAVVNVHHFADQIMRHVDGRQRPHVIISDEREQLLDTGGGIANSLGTLGDDPFFVVNADTIWIEGVRPNLERLATTATSIGYEGRGDFALAPDGWLRRRGEREIVPFVYAGAGILAPKLFDNAPAGPFSLTRLFDRAEAQGRLYGLRLEGLWMHVGTPAAIAEAEAAIIASAA